MKSPSELRKERLESFLHDTNQETFVSVVRDFMKESIMMTLKVDENKFTPDKAIISEGFYFLNELCDIIDPNKLEVKASSSDY